MKNIDITTMNKEDMIETMEALDNKAYDIYLQMDNLKVMMKQIEDAIDALEDIEDVFDDRNNWNGWYDTVHFLKEALKDCDKTENDLGDNYYEHVQASHMLEDAIDKMEEKEGA